MVHLLPHIPGWDADHPVNMKIMWQEISVAIILCLVTYLVIKRLFRKPGSKAQDCSSCSSSCDSCPMLKTHRTADGSESPDQRFPDLSN